MSYQIARDGETIGTYTEDELVEAVENGSVLESDLAWTEGMEEWMPVEEIIEVEVVDEETGETIVEQETDIESTTTPLLKPLGRPLPEQPVAQAAPRIAPVPVRPVGPAQYEPHPVMPATHVEPVMVQPERYGAPPPQRMPGNIYGAIPAGHYGPAGSAVASLVLGLLSLVLCCFTGLPAIICGHLARGKIRRSNNAFSGHGMATAGLVLGYVTTTLTLLYGVFVLITGGTAALAVMKKTFEDLQKQQPPSIEHVPPAK